VSLGAGSFAATNPTSRRNTHARSGDDSAGAMLRPAGWSVLRCIPIEELFNNDED